MNVGLERICRCCGKADSVLRSLCDGCLQDPALRLDECRHGDLTGRADPVELRDRGKR